ncbi:MAG: nicotinate (nicotinamide) nucleotide adenylyltransferase [Aquificota bacterium]|nr:MAG: nicotinate (nicotinamide) nucleotide adenylyltransferase [Aquificota bacterium]
MILFFGGSFDPVHVGHLIVARDVLEGLGALKVVFVPAYQAPLKEPHRASPQDRLNMLRLALQGQEGFEVSTVEIQRGGISYTVDTARELYKSLKERPTFLVGADSFLSLHMWKEPVELLKLARFVVIDREGKQKEVLSYVKERFPWLKEGEDYTLLSVRRIDVSSTEIRRRLAQGKSVRWLLPEKVEDYILQRGLYRNP